MKFCAEVVAAANGCDDSGARDDAGVGGLAHGDIAKEEEEERRSDGESEHTAKRPCIKRKGRGEFTYQ